MKGLMLRYMAAFSLVLVLVLTGCSGSDSGPSIRQVKSALKKARKKPDPKVKVYYLYRAYEQTRQMEEAAPPPEKLDEFLQKYGAEIDGIPQQVYSLSMQAGEFEAFEWALANGAKVDVHYNELLKFWELGSEWRDYILAEHLEIALPVFMDQAIQGFYRLFFREHLAEFKDSGFKLHRLMGAIEFNSRFCRFLADEIDRAMGKGDNKRIHFLVDNMPSLPAVNYIDAKTAEIMRDLGDYALYTLEDEDFFCQLLELGYEQNRIDLTNPVVGDKLTNALRANPESAVRALDLDEWRGKMTQAEFEFLNSLPESALGSLSQLYVIEAIELSMVDGDDEGVLRFIQLRAQMEPFSRGGYDQLMNLSLKYGSEAGFGYVMEHRKKIDIYTFDLAYLAENQVLFVRYAPKIMKKIYYTMDTSPRKDGTTLGRIYEAFTADNEQAGLFIVKKYNLSEKWVETTEGRTLLMDVCRSGNLAAVRYLVEERGADVLSETGYREMQISLFGRTHATEGKLSPIFFAAESGNGKLITYLVQEKRANVNARSNFGATPLMHAVSAGQLEAVETLIALGANVNAKMDPNLNHQIELTDIAAFDDISNAYRRARVRGNKEILEVLKKAGARL